jgi:hypothetical protein
MARRVCEECGKPFEGRGDSRYDTDGCRQKAYRRRQGAVTVESSKPMTSGERKELLQLVRRREKLAKTNADVRGKELMADFEHQMASLYSFDENEVWAKAMAKAQAALSAADAEVAEECRRLGIPEEFRGGIHGGWSARGQNTLKERRDELHRVARTQVDALIVTAKQAIEEGSVTAQEQLAVSGLKSAEAHALLAAMPTPEQLMPALAVEGIEKALTTPKMGAQEPRLLGHTSSSDRYLLDANGRRDYSAELPSIGGDA